MGINPCTVNKLMMPGHVKSAYRLASLPGVHAKASAPAYRQVCDIMHTHWKHNLKHISTINKILWNL
jgi:hypothetical protein